MLLSKAGYFAVVVVGTLLVAGQARANILVVDDDNVPCFSAPYHNINAALAVAEAGDEIDVCPGLYSEQVVLTKVLTLRGMPVGSQKAVIMPPALPSCRLQVAVVLIVPVISAHPSSSCQPPLRPGTEFDRCVINMRHRNWQGLP